MCKGEYLSTMISGGNMVRWDSTEKIWAHQFLAKPKTIEAGGLGGALSPPGGPGQCLGECMYAISEQFFSYTTAEMV